MALGYKREELGLDPSTSHLKVYAIVMDWDMGNGTTTTVAYLTGDASIYLSSGGGVVGGGRHATVNHAAKQFLQLAQTYLEKAVKATGTPLPSKNEVRFYLLTNDGIFEGKEQMRNFENGSSAWLALFEEGNKVITELREVSARS
ncbi:MAG: hypothetical protein U0176_11510 [Bacteroidia bacterium]